MGNTLNIGFVGGGQLAMMTALEAKKISDYDFRINILDPSADCPAHRFASKHIIGDFKDRTAIRSL
ncbi:MAG: 5-(carboxyamino)imidazole ribonucleotide synthase, partial [Nitrososphaerales archaeon]